jgi:hypothetical protein
MRFAQGCWPRGVVLIGTRLLNLSVADNDHPEPMVQDIGPGGTGGDEQVRSCMRARWQQRDARSSR